ncbi:MAG: SpoVS, partial [uncultured Acidimicrobiales bacterium]
GRGPQGLQQVQSQLGGRSPGRRPAPGGRGRGAGGRRWGPESGRQGHRHRPGLRGPLEHRPGVHPYLRRHRDRRPEPHRHPLGRGGPLAPAGDGGRSGRSRSRLRSARSFGSGGRAGPQL